MQSLYARISKSKTKVTKSKKPKEVSRRHPEPEIPAEQGSNANVEQEKTDWAGLQSPGLEDSSGNADKHEDAENRNSEFLEASVPEEDGAKPAQKLLSSSAENNPERTENVPLVRAAKNDRVLGILIHSTDRLKTKLYISHPLVKVHLVGADTGQPIAKTSKQEIFISFCAKGTVLQQGAQCVYCLSFDKL